MNVLIIEDEAPAFRRLQKVLEEIDTSINIIDVIGTVSESICWFNENKLPDLVFMDIQLSDGISFEIFESISVKTPVIFTTAFDEYVLNAFKVNSIDYILKPIKKEELEKSIEKYKSLKEVYGGTNEAGLGDFLKQIDLGRKKYKNRFLIKLPESLLSIDVSEIAYFQTKKGIVQLVTREGRKYITDFTLDDLIQQIDPYLFFRANRQFIIHIETVSQAHKYFKGKLLVETTPDPDEKILVSAEKASLFKSWLGGS